MVGVWGVSVFWCACGYDAVEERRGFAALWADVGDALWLLVFIEIVQIDTPGVIRWARGTAVWYAGTSHPRRHGGPLLLCQHLASYDRMVGILG